MTRRWAVSMQRLQLLEFKVSADFCGDLSSVFRARGQQPPPVGMARGRMAEWHRDSCHGCIIMRAVLRGVDRSDVFRKGTVKLEKVDRLIKFWRDLYAYLLFGKRRSRRATHMHRLTLPSPTHQA